MARQNLPPDPPDPSSTSADDTSKINVTEPPTAPFQGRWRFGDIDLGPLPSVAELIASTTDARTGAPRHRRGVRIAHGALNLDKAERLCRFHAILTGNADTGSCSTKVWPCDSMQEPYCGTNNLADRRQEAIADLRARPTVHVGTVPFSESKRKAINQAEKRAGATVWHLPMSRPHVVIDEWQTSVPGRAETPEIWVLFGDRPYSTKGVTWAEMTGPDAATLFDICCTVPYVPKVPRRTNCVEEATTPVPAPDAAADTPDAPTTSLVLDPSRFDEDSWDTDDDPDADPHDYLPDPLDLDSDLTPDYTHEWQIEPAEARPLTAGATNWAGRRIRLLTPAGDGARAVSTSVSGGRCSKPRSPKTRPTGSRSSLPTRPKPPSAPAMGSAATRSAKRRRIGVEVTPEPLGEVAPHPRTLFGAFQPLDRLHHVLSRQSCRQVSQLARQLAVADRDHGGGHVVIVGKELRQ